MAAPISNVRPKPAKVLVDIADDVIRHGVGGKPAYETVGNVLSHMLGCGLETLEYSARTERLGPIVRGPVVPNRACARSTHVQLDPVQAAPKPGTMIRWLDFNDTWLAAEWGHPCDHLSGIRMTAAWLSRNARTAGHAPLTMRNALEAMVKAHGIQGVIALENSINKVGRDHVVRMKVTSTAAIEQILRRSRDEIIEAVSRPGVDGEALRTDRHAPNRGSRKSRAAGEATSRAVRPALIAQTVRKITIRTHEARIRIIDKKGPLNDPADRKHCIQHMVAVPLPFGRASAGDDEDAVAVDPRTDALRQRIVCVEAPDFTTDFNGPRKRSIANALAVELDDRRTLDERVCEYPIGHERLRKEGGRCSKPGSGATWRGDSRRSDRTRSSACRSTGSRSRRWWSTTTSTFS